MKTRFFPIYITLFILALVMPITAKSYIANSLETEQLEKLLPRKLAEPSLKYDVLVQTKQVNRSSNRKSKNIINSEDVALKTVLNTGVIRRKIQLLEKRGARIGTMVDLNANEKRTKYYFVQLQEIKPERNVTIDAFCVYRSGVVDRFDYVKDRCVGLQNYR